MPVYYNVWATAYTWLSQHKHWREYLLCNADYIHELKYSIIIHVYNVTRLKVTVQDHTCVCVYSSILLYSVI
jgi:hypothetical protein